MRRGSNATTVFHELRCKDPNLSWASRMTLTNCVLQKTHSYRVTIHVWLSGARRAGSPENARKGRSLNASSSATAGRCSGITPRHHHNTCSDTHQICSRLSPNKKEESQIPPEEQTHGCNIDSVSAVSLAMPAGADISAFRSVAWAAGLFVWFAGAGIAVGVFPAVTQSQFVEVGSAHA